MNASPLIVLGRLARLELLSQLAEEVIVPEGVLAEVAARSDQGWVAHAVERCAGLTVQPDVTAPASLDRWNLGRGERCAIAQAIARPGSTAVLDDQRARKAAAAHDLAVIGTLGILVRAKGMGLIPAVGSLIAAMKGIGFYASDELIAETLSSAGEKEGE